jgi:hypothetical protein
MPQPLCIYIDSNVWDFLHYRNFDLSIELPREEFSLCLTRETEFEISLMPPDKKAYVDKAIQTRNVETRPYFGFGNPDLSPDKQRVAGFDQGHFITYEEAGFIQQQHKKRPSKKIRPTGLSKHAI